MKNLLLLHSTSEPAAAAASSAQPEAAEERLGIEEEWIAEAGLLLAFVEEAFRRGRIVDFLGRRHIEFSDSEACKFAEAIKRLLASAPE